MTGALGGQRRAGGDVRVRQLPGGAELIVAADLEACGVVAAGLLAGALAAALPARGRADWLTTGGSAAGPIYRALRSAHHDALDWRAVHVWWGDERNVPRDHPLSNAQPFEQIALGAASLAGQSGSGSGIEILAGAGGALPIPVANVHEVPIDAAIASGGGVEAAATAYDAELRQSGLPMAEDGCPIFDAVLLGVGPDGHVLSVFPGSAAWDEPDWAIAVPAPTHVEPHVARVTIHPQVVGVARRVVVVAAGAGKAERLAEVLAETGGERDLPARAALVPNATWVLDEAAAAHLPR